MKKFFRTVLIVIVVEILGLIWVQQKGILQSPDWEIIPPSTPTPTALPTISDSVKNEPAVMENEPAVKKKIIEITPTPNPNEKWGVSQQVDDHTWTIKLGEDVTMATPQEILTALNQYRQVHGAQVLNWDEKLGNYAQDRAKYLNSIKSVDEHKGFSDFLENQDGFNKLGFNSLGENISYGYRLNGVHTIEWMYAGDKPHNDNQLDNRRNYVGIGVNGLATCLIFGTGKF